MIKNIKVKVAQKEKKQLKITTDFIRLDSALKLADIAATGGISKIMIQNGEINVNGEVCLQRGKKLRAGDFFKFGNKIFEITD